MALIISKFLVIFIVMYSVHMIYFYFRNKSKKHGKEFTIEMLYLLKIYGINVNNFDKKIVERHISLINSVIVAIDLLIYFYLESMILKLLIMFALTILLVYIGYGLLAKYYRK